MTTVNCDTVSNSTRKQDQLCLLRLGYFAEASAPSSAPEPKYGLFIETKKGDGICPVGNAELSQGTFGVFMALKVTCEDKVANLYDEEDDDDTDDEDEEADDDYDETNDEEDDEDDDDDDGSTSGGGNQGIAGGGTVEEPGLDPKIAGLSAPVS